MTKTRCYFNFLVLILQLLNRNSKIHKNIGKKLSFAKQIFAVEPISLIFSEFNSGIWGQYRENIFHILFSPNFFASKYFY